MNIQTTTTPKTVREAATMLYRALITDKRNNGETFYKLQDGSPEWMTEAIHAAHGDEMPNDTVYAFIGRAAGAFADGDAETDNEYSEVIAEMEADVYTSDLTGWLHESVNYVAYCDQAAEEFGAFESIFDLLMAAQKLHIEEVAYALYRALDEMIQDLPEEEFDPSVDVWTAERLRGNTFAFNVDFLDLAEIDYWWWLDDNTYSRE